jgi:4-hydroxyphenylpyruvate dioxygenase-like putative hemolysin
MTKLEYEKDIWKRTAELLFQLAHAQAQDAGIPLLTVIEDYYQQAKDSIQEEGYNEDYLVFTE